MEDWQNGGFGLYVHWPICTSKCPYCDFNSHVNVAWGFLDPGDQAQSYVTALDHYGRELPGRVLNSIYFGGGTPSLMEPIVVEQIIEAARSHWRFANDIEITMEANPGSVDAGRFQAYARAGVNRLSLGIQALDDQDLMRLGRAHRVDDALRALEIAQGQFDRVSFDLIYARPHQTLDTWEKELERALSFGTEHMSLYQLTIEPSTAFGRWFEAGKLPGLPGEDLAADMFVVTQKLCENKGLHAYEVSNHARAGARSVHNMIYWQAGDYLGIGPGAHGRLTLNGARRYATEAPRDPAVWASKVRKNRSGESLRQELTALDQAQEYLLMGLRTQCGVELSRLERFGFVPDPDKLDELKSIGMITVRKGTIRATQKGILLLNAVLGELALSL